MEQVYLCLALLEVLFFYLSFAPEENPKDLNTFHILESEATFLNIFYSGYPVNIPVYYQGS